jgi:hypothetical protein
MKNPLEGVDAEAATVTVEGGGDDDSAVDDFSRFSAL